MPSGMRPYCLECERAWKRKWYSLNREKSSAWRKAWYVKNADYARAYARAWSLANSEKRRASYLANLEKNQAQNHLYYLQNKERYYEWTRKWRTANPDKIRSLVRNRRARLRNAEGLHTDNDIRRLWWFQKGCCQYCGVKLGKSFHVDHMIPLSRGGSNYPSNIALSCGSCNDRKHMKTAEEFYKVA